MLVRLLLTGGMRIWHMTSDAGREPLRVAPGQAVRLVIGTSPIEPGQVVGITYSVIHADGAVDRGSLNIPWHHNGGHSSYWAASFGPFAQGDRVTYIIHGSSPSQQIDLPPVQFAVGPRIYLSFLWHQHQPSYQDTAAPPQGSLAQPWVRLHALRSYYAMPALGAAYPGLRQTFNLTPVLLSQVEQYVQNGATDRMLDLTRKPVHRLSGAEREMLLNRAFDVNWRDQILPFPRYLELYRRRRAGEAFANADLRDLKMWYNLAWFDTQFQRGTVSLADGQQASVQRFVEQQSGFSEADVEEMIGEQYKIMAAILPLYRQLQDQGAIEVSTSPFYHPILPLLYDTNTATIDRPGTCLPPRFHYPQDADAQVALAVEYYRERFGRAPQGMWPSEGAVSAEIIPILIRHGIEWAATDQGVLQKSGRWGYQAYDPDVLCRPYRLQSDGRSLGIFFRDMALSNLISFHYHQAFQNMDLAAQDLLQRIGRNLADRFSSQEDRVLSIILDGENTWNAYGPRAIAFFGALWRRLAESSEIETVTFSEYLHGEGSRGISPHPVEQQEPLYELYTASWIDEAGSEPGVDLGTWVGEPDENQAWRLLGEARQALAEHDITPESNPRAFQALYMAEGSDWFWWLGFDHLLTGDQQLESVFRLHLTNAYRLAGLEPPAALARSLVPWGITWALAQPSQSLGPQEQLVVRTNCPGSLLWQAGPAGAREETALQPVPGDASTVKGYQVALGPFSRDVREVRLSFRCREHLAGSEVCLAPEVQAVPVGDLTPKGEKEVRDGAR